MDGERVDGHEDQADQGDEHHVHEVRDQHLRVGPRLLHLLQDLPRALVLEDGVGKGEGVGDAPLVQLRADALGDDVDEVVLEVLGDARDERDADVGQEEQQHAAHEDVRRDVPDLHRVPVDDQPEHLRVEEGEDLVDGGQQQRAEKEPFVAGEVVEEEMHRGTIS